MALSSMSKGPAVALLAALALAGPALAQQAAAPTAQPHTPGMPDITFPDRPSAAIAPQVTPFPGAALAYDYSRFTAQPAPQKAPDGFTLLFNGRDLTGWHISKTARHGHTPDFHVSQGMIIATQQPIGGGGLLISDKKFKNYEFYAEAKADWGADSGVFVRTTEDGSAYQVTLDYMPGGSMGRVIAEGGLVGVGRPVGQETTRPAAAAPAAGAAPAAPRADPGMSAWKHNDWNTIRVRVEGDTPHISVWINGVQTMDLQEAANRAAGGMVTGPIALQVHGGPHRWLPGNFWRWRNIGIKELP